MATVTKDFRVKNGLVVEGANGTIDGSDIITGDLITGGNQENIIVTYDAVNKRVNFVAENGVADSTTDDLVEGVTNLYYTDERAQDAINNALSGSYGHITITYDDAANSFIITNDATSANTPSTLVERNASGNFSGNNISAEGTLSSVGNTTVGGDLDVTGSSTVTGNHSVTGTSTISGNENVGGDLAVSGNTNITGTLGVTGTITGNLTGDVTGNADTATALETARNITVSGDVDGTTSFDGTADVDINVTLDTVNSNVGTFGSTTQIPSVTVNAKGLVTGVTTNDVATNLSIAGDTGTDSVFLLNDTLTFTGSDGVTMDVTDNNVTATVDTGNGIQIDGTGNVEIDTTVTVDVDSTQTLTNKTLGSTTTLGADLNANNNRITGLFTNFNPDDDEAVNGGTLRDNIFTHAAETSLVHGVEGDIVGTTDAQTLSNKTLGSILNANDNTITNLPEPTQATHAATKNYVDTVAEGLSVKPAVLAATSSNLTATYDNGTDGVDSTLNLGPLATLDIDGVTIWSEGDGVLVKDQTNAFENGRYYVVQVGDAGTDWILKRCFKCDEPDEIPSSYVFVQEGTIYNATGWVAEVENPSTFTVGVDDVNWIQFSGAGTYTAANGLTLNGTEFEIDTAVTVDLNSTQTLTNKSIDSAENTIAIDLSEANVTGTHAEFNAALSDGTFVEIDAAQTLTNKSISGSANTLTNIPNSAMVNDSITVNGYETDLGQSVTLDTDDVAEGTGNLYFTDARAVSALQGTDSSFTTVDIDSIAKQVAATASISGTGGPEVAYSFDTTTYRSAKFLVKLAEGTHTEVSEILVTLDTANNVAITEYAIVGTNGDLGTVSAEFNAGTDELELTVTNNSPVTATVMGTLLI